MLLLWSMVASERAVHDRALEARNATLVEMLAKHAITADIPDGIRAIHSTSAGAELFCNLFSQAQTVVVMGHEIKDCILAA